MNFLFVKNLFLISLIKILLVEYGLCTVSIRPLQMTSIGANVTIYCDLVSESLANLLWRRTDYDGTNNLNLISTNVPSRYNITSTEINTSNHVSLLTITGVQSNDFATFVCSDSTVVSVNLTEAPTTTTTTTTTTSTHFDPLNLCFNYSYNSVLYALILFSIIVLAVLLFGFLKLIRPTTIIDIIITFCCVLSSIGFIIVAIIFWISPDYVAASPANEYWSPIIIVPCLMVALVLIWISIYYFAIRSFLTDKIINKIHMIVVSSIAFIQLFFSLIILCSVVYCTGNSSLPSASINYSILSDICSGIILLSCFVFVVYFFYIFKEQLNDRIGVVSLDKIKIDDFPKSPQLNIDRSKMSSNMDYYFKNPDTVEPYKIDKDKITTAISLIETTRLEQLNKDEKIKMRFANEQIGELSSNSDYAYFKQENSIAKININTDSKSDLIPIQENEKIPAKKKLKKTKIKGNDTLVITSIDLEGGETNNLTINENDDVEILGQKTAEKKKFKKKVKKNTEPLNNNENGEVIEINDDLKSESGSVTLKKKLKKKKITKTVANESINAEDDKSEKKVKKTKKKEDTKSEKDRMDETLNLEPSGDGEKKNKKKISEKDTEPN